MRILHVEPDRYDPDLRALLETQGEVHWYDCHDQESFEKKAAECDPTAVFAKLGLEFGDALLSAAPSIRWIVTPTTGTNHIDVEAASARGVRIIHLRGQRDLLEDVSTTAEHAWALLLMMCRRCHAVFDAVQELRWEREPFVSMELRGRTLGIAGLGRLGGMVATYGWAFGMKVLGFDREPGVFERFPFVIRVDEEDLLAGSDVLSLHLPLDATTQGWLDESKIRQMRPGSILVNTARGELVDEQALRRALESGALAGAGLDVLCGDATWTDSVPEGHPIVELSRRHPRVVVTSHVGGYGVQAIRKTREFVTREFIREAGASRTR
jgi:D-3-phosphoglycerate dehydrogenase